MCCVMDGGIIYNETNIPVYETNEIDGQYHHHHHQQQQLPPQHEQTHMMGADHHQSQHHQMLSNEQIPSASSSGVNNYDGSCWHFMPPDYPYYPEDDFR